MGGPRRGGQVSHAFHVAGQAGRPAAGQDAAPVAGSRVRARPARRGRSRDRPIQHPERVREGRGGPDVRLGAATGREPRYCRIPVHARQTGQQQAAEARPTGSRPRPARAGELRARLGVKPWPSGAVPRAEKGSGPRGGAGRRRTVGRRQDRSGSGRAHAGPGSCRPVRWRTLPDARPQAANATAPRPP